MKYEGVYDVLEKAFLTWLLRIVPSLSGMRRTEGCTLRNRFYNDIQYVSKDEKIVQVSPILLELIEGEDGIFRVSFHDADSLFEAIELHVLFGRASVVLIDV